MQSKSIDDTSRRMLDLQFDFGEVSIGTFIRGRDRGVPLVALPLFTNSRQFLNVNLHVATRAGIQDLSQLRGRSIGAPHWTASSLWQRQFLHDFYGLEAEDMAWVTFQPSGWKGWTSRPARVTAWRRNGRRGAWLKELDAVTTASGRRSDGSERPSALVPFFPDRAAGQRAYYERTGIYPLQYVVVTREELAGPTVVVASVCEAFVRAKEIAGSRGPLGSPDLVALVGDPWPYRLTANRNPGGIGRRGLSTGSDEPPVRPRRAVRTEASTVNELMNPAPRISTAGANIGAQPCCRTQHGKSGNA